MHTQSCKNHSFTVIFDMDGVIVNSEFYWKEIEGEFLRDLVGEWSSVDQEKITGRSIFDVYDLLVCDYGLKKSLEEILGYYHGLALDVYGHRVAMTDGCCDLLEELKSHNVPLAIASSSPRGWIDIVLDRFHLRGLFNEVLSGEDFPGRGKPAPDIYLKAVELLKLLPGQCVAIEDSAHGILSAKSAGVYCVALCLDGRFAKNHSQADMAVRSFSELSYSRLQALCKSRMSA